jgi:kelch-like protein 24/35
MIDKNGVEVQVGDIVFFERESALSKYYHAALYQGLENETHYLIHFWNPTGEDFKLSDTFTPLKKAVVIRSTFEQVRRNSTFFINNWLDDKMELPYTPSQVIERAISRLDETGYNLLWNNCQHFCSYIRYGKCESYQLEKIKNIAKRQFTRSIAQHGTKLAHKTSRGIIKQAAKHLPRVVKLQSVANAVKSETSSRIGKSLLGGAVSGIVEASITGVKLWKKNKKYKNKMDAHQVSKRLKQSAFKSAATGSIIGQTIIPVPIIGSFIGGCVGEYIGSTIASKQIV